MERRFPLAVLWSARRQDFERQHRNKPCGTTSTKGRPFVQAKKTQEIDPLKLEGRFVKSHKSERSNQTWVGRSLLGRLLQAEKGATAAEFALVATPLTAVLFASIQFAEVFYFDQVLQTAAVQAGRSLMVGSPQKQTMTASQFKAAVCTSLSSAFNCSSLMIDVQSANSFSTLNTTPIRLTYSGSGQVTNDFSYSPGSQGSVVIIRLLYAWPVFGSVLAPGLDDQGNNTHLLVGTSVIKIEPYT
jgi:Flp pilus assembly protein TadG